ncbi:uncharacterized protein LOC106461965 isoform X2 [Limulus polyphemus]|uniref:Uncharacterized protein LOC106461965 isoform X2 n=1 Tax=Limulus polyphemus TaxID=6850 RepID=A0ABM1SMB4_LIMPO|nr:uncharacterized protein LOC106461965 isoform X2 [Limulus polyphemus]
MSKTTTKSGPKCKSLTYDDATAEAIQENRTCRVEPIHQRDGFTYSGWPRPDVVTTTCATAGEPFDHCQDIFPMTYQGVSGAPSGDRQIGFLSVGEASGHRRQE